MMAAKFSFVEHQNATLAVLYEFLIRDIQDSATISQIKEVLGDLASGMLLEKVIQKIYHEDGLLYFGKAAGDETDWRLTSKGIETAGMLDTLAPNIYTYVVNQFEAKAAQHGTAEVSTPAQRAEISSEISYSEFKDRLLIALADHEETENDAYNYEPANIAVQADIPFKPGWIRKAVTSFGDYGFVKPAFTMGGGEDGGLACALTGEGLEEAERLRTELQADSNFTASSKFFDAADIWVPLPLEVPALKREEIANDLEGLKEDVRSSNGYADTYPAEHNNIVWALGSAVNGFREGLFTRYLIEMCVVRPLNRLIEIFPEAAIQVAAQGILVKVIEIFRDFLTKWGLL